MPISESIQQAAWRRLKKNKGAVFGMIVIALSVVVAISAYFLAADHSPYTNRMMVEIGGAKPGYRQQFLLVRKAGTVPQRNIFDRLLNGQEDDFTRIPIAGYQSTADSIIVEKYIDEGISERQAFAWKDIVAAAVKNQAFHQGATAA